MASLGHLPFEGFGDRLKRLVKARGLDNGILAKGLGVHIVTVSYWMGGRVPKGPTLVRLARLLGVSAEYLLDGREPAEDQEPATVAHDRPANGDDDAETRKGA